MDILETDRLFLREFITTDAPFILDLLNDPAFLQFIGDRQVRTLADAEKYIEMGPVASYVRNGFGLCLVLLKDTETPIGMCGLIKRDALEDVDIGYAFLPQHRSKGYALEAVQAVKAYAREVVKLKRLVAIVDPANERSVRVLEKIGMSFEKLIKLSADDIDLKLFACDLDRVPEVHDVL